MGSYRLLLDRLADLFSYPGEFDLLAACGEMMSTGHETGGAFHNELARFFELAQGLSCSQLEEIYIGTFDLASETCPYIGYLLFGDNYKRTEFMVKLKETFRENGFEDDRDLPDHIAVILRFIASSGVDNPVVIDLVSYAIHPALKTLIGKLEKNSGENPYFYLLRGVWIALNEIAPPVIHREEVST